MENFVHGTVSSTKFPNLFIQSTTTRGGIQIVNTTKATSPAVTLATTKATTTAAAAGTPGTPQTAATPAQPVLTKPPRIGWLDHPMGNRYKIRVEIISLPEKRACTLRSGLKWGSYLLIKRRHSSSDQTRICFGTNQQIQPNNSETAAPSSDSEAGETPPTAKVTTTVKTPPPDDYEPGESKIIDGRKCTVLNLSSSFINFQGRKDK